jgi:hypothetical protein
MPVKLAVSCVAVVVAAALSAPACSGTDGGLRNSDAGRGACVTAPGGFPAADCEYSTNNCGGIKPGCAIDESVCGSKSTCLPTADNAGKPVVDLRFRRLNVTAPPALSQAFIQRGIVDQGINLKAVHCGENGDGAFNWLLRVDKANKKVTTGGAPPSSDPLGLGYCFANTTPADGLHVAAATASVTYAGDTFTAEKIPKLNVPIFVHGDPTKLIILPLSQTTLKDVTISADGNCVGGFDFDHVNADCSDIREDCSRWHTAGALGGFMTLEEADRVPIPDLANKSLCVLLTAATKFSPDGLRCQRDASNAIIARGDYCSTTDAPGGCADSYWLAATFAAAAAKVYDGASDANCNGAAPATDGGADAAAD